MFGQTEGSDVERQPQILVEEAKLEQSIDKLSDLLSQLDSRLAPVLSEVSKPGKDGGIADEANLCLVAKFLSSQTERLGEMIKLSSDILFRLEL